MPTAVDYEDYDFRKVKTVLSGSGLSVASLQALVGAGWVGIFEPGETINPAPEPRPDLRTPTLFMRWDVAYTAEPSSTLDPDGDVTREGIVRLALRYQPGALQGAVNIVFRECRSAFKAASSSSDVAFFIESASEYRPPQAGWSVRELPLRFMGV